MSVNRKYELYKVKREIKRNGQTIEFFRAKLNDYGEPTEELECVHKIKGLYYEFAAHQLDTYIQERPVNGGIARTKRTPQILCPWDDLFFLNKDNEDDHIMVNDIVYLNGIKSLVVGVVNVMNWNTIAHITFTEVDYGTINGSRPEFINRKQDEQEWQNLN